MKKRYGYQNKIVELTKHKIKYTIRSLKSILYIMKLNFRKKQKSE